MNKYFDTKSAWKLIRFFQMREEGKLTIFSNSGQLYDYLVHHGVEVKPPYKRRTPASLSVTWYAKPLARRLIEVQPDLTMKRLLVAFRKHRTGDKELNARRQYGKFISKRRRDLYIAAKFKCCHCRKSFHDQQHNLTIDHIKPVYFFPELRFTEENLQVLCRRCNKKKGHYRWALNDILVK